MARQVLALRVRALRRTRGWSQGDLADASGLHRTYVGGVERAERNCTLDVLVALASALDVSPAELLTPGLLDQPDGVKETPSSYGARSLGQRRIGRVSARLRLGGSRLDPYEYPHRLYPRRESAWASA